MNEKLDKILMALATGKAAAKILDHQEWIEEIEAALEACHELQKDDFKKMLGV
jgi:hypothetical protein